MRGHELTDPQLSKELLDQTELVWERKSSRLDLRRFMSKSALVLPERFSFYRTYLIFRTLGRGKISRLIKKNFNHFTSFRIASSDPGWRGEQGGGDTHQEGSHGIQYWWTARIKTNCIGIVAIQGNVRWNIVE